MTVADHFWTEKLCKMKQQYDLHRKVAFLHYLLITWTDINI